MKHNLILIALIFALLHLANLTEALSYLSRPMVTAAAGLLGIEAYNQGTDIVLGSLVLPWTQDCSGVNTLIILWGLTLWAYRDKALSAGLLLRLVLCIPAALLANVLRIFTLAAYRYTFYPAWESEELHYLIGFFWILPFIALFIENIRSLSRDVIFELLYLSIVLSLLATVIFSPGGSLVALVTLVFVSQSRPHDSDRLFISFAYIAWILSAILITLAEMESLWIPWLLLNPRIVSRSLLLSPHGVILLSGTITVAAMHPIWQWVVIAALLYSAYRIYADNSVSDARIHATNRFELATMFALSLLPFVLPSVLGVDVVIETPPRGSMMTKQLSDNSFEIRLTRQAADVRAFWYGAYGDGRHHSLESCMRFRGIVLESTEPKTDVMQGNGMWMRDYYIHNGQLHENYQDYLLSSFSPFSSPGVHLIFDAPQSAMGAEFFEHSTAILAERIYYEYLSKHSATSVAVY